jgi:hypothetical protein
MPFDPIDRQRLRRDIASISAQCRELNRVLSRIWTRPTADEQRRKARLARRATELLVLLARTRGRFHITSPPRDLRAAAAPWDRDAWNNRIAARVALDYAPPSPSQANEVATP